MKLSLPYSDKLKQILSYSREEAMRLHNMSIEPEHLMLGIIRDGENHAFRILQNELLLNVQEYKHNLEDNLKQYAMSTETADNIVVGEETSNILRLGLLEAKLLKSDSISFSFFTGNDLQIVKSYFIVSQRAGDFHRNICKMAVKFEEKAGGLKGQYNEKTPKCSAKTAPHLVFFLFNGYNNFC